MLFGRMAFAIPYVLTLSISSTQANELLNVLENSQADIASLSSLKQGDSLRFSLQIAGQPLDTTDLQHIDVFAPDAQINLQGKNGITSISPPKTNYFSGQIAGVTDSQVFLDLTNLQSIKGIISLKDKVYIYNNESTSYQSRKIINKQIPIQSATDIFQCLTENNQTEKYLSKPLTELDLSSLKERATTDKNTYISNLTIESDYEYYGLFNDQNKAIKYTADLIAYTSSIYKRELNSILKIKKLNIYLTNDNPWGATDTTGLLNSLESHYRNNQLVTTKDSAIHLLSGKRIGGLAYIGSLCNNSTNFGVSGGLYGTFNINNPQIVWDAKVIAHELGHNFGAMHTHTYSPQPIDCCYSESTASVCANYEPYTQLPGLNSLTGGEPEKGTGTIMSYCHKVTGKLNNISLTLGRNHPYGIEADRVPDSMRATLLSAKQYYPQCLATYFPGFSRGIPWSTNQIPSNNTLVTGDFNGDNKTDLIDLALTKNSDIYVSLSDTSSFINRKIWLDDFPINKTLPLVGDINGDGKDDLIKLPTDYKGLAIIANSNGNFFKTTQQWMLTKPETEGQYILGDFNGDKKSDLGFLAKNSKNIYVANSNGKSFSPFKIWLSNINYNMDNINFADFNGDRKYDISFTDLVKPKAIYVILSSGKNFKASRLWAKSANENYNLKAADFNADGLADLFYTNSAKLNVMLSNKTSFEPSQEVGTFNNQNQTRFYTGKFDIDNAADILTFSKDTTAILEVMPSLIR